MKYFLIAVGLAGLVIVTMLAGLILGSTIMAPNIPPITQVYITQAPPITQIVTVMAPVIQVHPITQVAITRIVITQIVSERIVTATPLPVAAADIPTSMHRPGTYLVNSEIAPGKWRNNGTSNCYWEILSSSGDIMENDFGTAGGIMFIPSNGYVVTLDEECGDWTYLGP